MSDLLKRALHTAWQTGLTVFLLGLVDVFNAFQRGLEPGKAALLGLAGAAVAAALSALKTYVSQTK
jgi:hypothetical protein